MRTIDDYIDLARSRSRISSDRELNKRLGRGNYITHLRTRRQWPSESVMLRLAELAEVPPEQALLDLCRWRTSGEAATVYAMLLQRVAGASLVAAVLAGALAVNILCPSPADAAEQTAHKGTSALASLYIMRAA